MRLKLSTVVASVTVLAVFLGVTVAGCLYINRVAAGIGRAPVMFAPGTWTVTGWPLTSRGPHSRRSRPCLAEPKRPVAAGDGASARSPAVGIIPRFTPGFTPSG